MSKIISVSGLIGSGKDTVADFLVHDCGYKRESFAGTLKDAVAAIFGWDREMLEGKTETARANRETVDKWWAERLNMPHLTPRWVLQNFGTEVCRRGFHDDIWIASLERKLDSFKDEKIVISDARFINELDLLKNAGAKTVWVRRGMLPAWFDVAARPDLRWQMGTTYSDVHRSEWDWAGYKFDQVMFNDSTLNDLFDESLKLGLH